MLRLLDRGQTWLWGLSPWRAAALVWVCTFVVFLVVIGRGWVAPYRLVADGQKVSATITKLLPDDHDGCVYSFTAASGRSYTERGSSCGTGRGVGDAITITYVADNPSVTTTGSPTAGLVTGLILNYTVPTLLGGFIGFEIARRNRRGG
jgi:hypothetical protein